MSARAVHLNLLRESERLSSSPVRIRVMLPVMAMLACIGMAVWWATLFGRLLIVSANTTSLEDDLIRKKNQHDTVIEQMVRANELESELEQLEYYRASRRPWGATLSALAEAMPLKVQLVKLEIPPPPPQNLKPPAGYRGPPIWGPTGVTEEVSLVLSGRTPKETPVISLMESLESEAFTNALVIAKDPRDPRQSPKVRSFRQDTSGGAGGPRMLAFEIEYRARERRFAK